MIQHFARSLQLHKLNHYFFLGTMVKTVGKYNIGKTLGEGTFGKVKFAQNMETGESVAIKVLDKEKIQKQSMGAQVESLSHYFQNNRVLAEE